MKSMMIALALVFASNLAQARTCDVEFKVKGLCASIEFAAPSKTGPVNSEVKDSPFVLTFWSKANPTQNVLPATVYEAELWMPSMGHGSKPTKVYVFAEAKVVSVTNVFFVMGGDWQIKLRLKDVVNGTSQVVDSGIFELSL